MASQITGYYGPTFPTIQIDKQTNYPNAANNIKKITVEEWQDLLHHTHKLPDILDKDGNFLGQNTSADGSVSIEAFNQLQETVQTQRETITTLTERLEALEAAVRNINTSSTNGIIIGDWDATKEGIQDEHGNTIG